jgi:hypothetical protein
MTKIYCKNCGKEFETQGEGDFSTFVCELCQDKVNMPAYEAEIAELGALKDTITESQKGRLKFLSDKVKVIKESIVKDAEEVAKVKEEEVGDVPVGTGQAPVE